MAFSITCCTHSSLASRMRARLNKWAHSRIICRTKFSRRLSSRSYRFPQLSKITICACRWLNIRATWTEIHIKLYWVLNRSVCLLLIKCPNSQLIRHMPIKQVQSPSNQTKRYLLIWLRKCLACLRRLSSYSMRKISHQFVSRITMTVAMLASTNSRDVLRLRFRSLPNSVHKCSRARKWTRWRLFRRSTVFTAGPSKGVCKLTFYRRCRKLTNHKLSRMSPRASMMDLGFKTIVIRHKSGRNTAKAWLLTWYSNMSSSLCPRKSWCSNSKWVWSQSSLMNTCRKN